MADFTIDEEYEKLLDEKIKLISLNNKLEEEYHETVQQDILTAKQNGQSFSGSVIIQTPRHKNIVWGSHNRNQSRHVPNFYNNSDFDLDTILPYSKRTDIPPKSENPPKEESSRGTRGDYVYEYPRNRTRMYRSRRPIDENILCDFTKTTSGKICYSKQFDFQPSMWGRPDRRPNSAYRPQNRRDHVQERSGGEAHRRYDRRDDATRNRYRNRGNEVNPGTQIRPSQRFEPKNDASVNKESQDWAENSRQHNNDGGFKFEAVNKVDFDDSCDEDYEKPRFALSYLQSRKDIMNDDFEGLSIDIYNNREEPPEISPPLMCPNFEETLSWPNKEDEKTKGTKFETVVNDDSESDFDIDFVPNDDEDNFNGLIFERNNF